MAIILHCDINNFYASVECVLNPALKKFPVVVAGSPKNRHGVVLAKNQVAKDLGIKYFLELEDDTMGFVHRWVENNTLKSCNITFSARRSRSRLRRVVTTLLWRNLSVKRPPTTAIRRRPSMTRYSATSTSALCRSMASKCSGRSSLVAII